MSSCLTICVRSVATPDMEEIRYYESESWSSETEKQFIARTQEIFSIARLLSKAVHVSISFETEDVKELSFLIQRKINKPVEINNQKLSIREIEVLGLIMQGHTNQEIADKLFISFETVRSHRKNILEKTGAKNTAALINHYHQTFFEK